MKLYLDDDLASPLLAARLRRTDTMCKARRKSVWRGRMMPSIWLTQYESKGSSYRNYTDFQNLHDLVVAVQGHHPGMLIVRRDNDPRRNLTHSDIVRAIAKLLAAGVPITDEYIILNHWR